MGGEASERSVSAFIGDVERIRIYSALAELICLGASVEKAAEALSGAYATRGHAALAAAVSHFGKEATEANSGGLPLVAAARNAFHVVTAEEEAVFSREAMDSEDILARSLQAAARMVALRVRDTAPSRD